MREVSLLLKSCLPCVVPSLSLEQPFPNNPELLPADRAGALQSRHGHWTSSLPPKAGRHPGQRLLFYRNKLRSTPPYGTILSNPDVLCCFPQCGLMLPRHGASAPFRLAQPLSPHGCLFSGAWPAAADFWAPQQTFPSAGPRSPLSREDERCAGPRLQAAAAGPACASPRQPGAGPAPAACRRRRPRWRPGEAEQ